MSLNTWSWGQENTPLINISIDFSIVCLLESSSVKVENVTISIDFACLVFIYGLFVFHFLLPQCNSVSVMYVFPKYPHFKSLMVRVKIRNMLDYKAVWKMPVLIFTKNKRLFFPHFNKINTKTQRLFFSKSKHIQLTELEKHVEIFHWRAYLWIKMCRFWNFRARKVNI